MSSASSSKTILLTAMAMIAFAANSLLCRAALAGQAIDAANFTAVRLVSGALTLLVIVRFGNRLARLSGGDWIAAAMLFVYALCFSLAYLSLSAGTGALILFGLVQLTMFIAGMRAGERFSATSWLGLSVAVAGVIYLVSPGVSAPSPGGAALMAAAGIAWGIYSLHGRGIPDPLGATAGNFARSVPMALLAVPLFVGDFHGSWPGVALATVSGALTSAVGYVIWYAALQGLTATAAATVQLSVPALAAFGGVLLLHEQVTARLLISSALILGGIALVFVQRRARAKDVIHPKSIAQKGNE